MSVFRKSQIISIILILFLLIFFGILYFNKSSNASNKDIKVTYGVSGNSSVITNELPLSDAIGKNYEYDKDNKFVGYNTIRISSLVDYSLKYEIYLVKKNDTKTIDDEYIKLYLCDNSNNALDGYDKYSVPNLSKLIDSNDSSKEVVLYKNSLKAKSTDNIIVKSWLSEAYSLNKEIKNFAYEIRVRVV